MCLLNPRIIQLPFYRLGHMFLSFVKVMLQIKNYHPIPSPLLRLTLSILFASFVIFLFIEKTK